MRWFEASPERPQTRFGVRAALVLVVTSLTVQTTRGDVTVAVVAAWPIVISADAGPAERYAAEELRNLMARATGSRLEIKVPGASPEVGFFLGRTSRLRVDDLGEEGSRVRIDDRRIEIAGGQPRGTLYGVYCFLEDALGVRFLTPDDTHVPHVDSSRTLKSAERVMRPRFRWRHSFYGANLSHPEFAARLRNNAVPDRAELGGRSNWTLISHSVNEYVPVARYGKVHPEYFSLVNGQRRSLMRDDQFEQGGTQPCFSNPDVKRLIIDGVLNRLSGRRQTGGNIAISQNDNTMYCRCDRCTAIDEREGSHMGALLTLVNEAGDAVARAYPGVFVGTLAYQFSRTPPRDLKPRSNVAIQLCSIEACQIHPLSDPSCPNNAAFCRDLEGWCQVCKHVYVWNYNTNFTCYNSPCPNLAVIGPNIRFLAAHGVSGVFMQAAGNAQNTELCELRNYLISRLLWDPALDDQQVIDEFLTLYYGRAAGKVRAYLSLIQATARRSGVHQHCFGSAASYGINANVARQGLNLLEEGMALAENDEVKQRVERVTIGPHTVMIEPLARWLRSHQHQIATGSSGNVPRELLNGIEDEIRTVFRLYEQYRVDRFAEWLTVSQVKSVIPEQLVLPTVDHSR
jgi:hypothetical protein